MEKTNTLADTILTDQISDVEIPNEQDLPPEFDLQDIFESAYDSSPAHTMREASTSNGKQGIEEFISYLKETDTDDPSYEEFTDAGFDTDLVGPKDFSRYNYYLKKGQYNDKVSAAGINKDFSNITGGMGPKAVKGASSKKEPEVDNRPEYDRNSIEDKLLAKLADTATSMKSETMSLAEIVDEKYKAIEEVAYRVACGKSMKRHAFIGGAAGCGKSFSVGKAVKEGLNAWRPSKRMPTKPKITQVFGSVGKAMSAILIFFFQHRQNEILVLDDADGFLVTQDQDVQNFLKAILDPDSHAVTTSYTMRRIANKALSKKEESVISVNTNRLREGKCSVNVNGQTFSFDVDREDAKKLAETFGAPKRIKESRPMFGYDKYGLKVLKESDFEMEDDFISEEDELIDELLDTGDGEDLIPEEWYFTSSLILISNLYCSEINEAVRSRCDCVELVLSEEEFFCKAEQILDSIKVAEDSANSFELIQWAKRESFALAKTAIKSSKIKNFPIAIQVNIPLEFRMVASLTGKWLARVDRYCMEHGIDPEDSKNWSILEEELFYKFIAIDCKNFFAGDTPRNTKKKK